MKLAQLVPQTCKFYLKHPVTLENITNDDGAEVFWNVVGHDSVQYHDSQQDFLKHLEKLGDKASDLKAKDYREQAVKQVSSLVIGWDEEFDDFHGGKFSKKKVAEILASSDYGWVMNQIDKFVAVRRNFFAEQLTIYV